MRSNRSLSTNAALELRRLLPSLTREATGSKPCKNCGDAIAVSRTSDYCRGCSQALGRGHQGGWRVNDAHAAAMTKTCPDCSHAGHAHRQTACVQPVEWTNKGTKRCGCTRQDGWV